MPIKNKDMNDKVKHFIATAAITLAVLAIFAVIQHPYMWGWDKAIALMTGCMVAAAKEVVWDKWLHRGDPDFYDFLAGVYGAFAAMFGWAVVETIIYVVKYGF